MEICNSATPGAQPATRPGAMSGAAANAMPAAIYTFGAGIFAMTTSEFMVAGLMPAMAGAFQVSVAEIGYLISVYSAGMVIGGPLLTLALQRFDRKPTLLALMLAFVLGQILGATAASYAVMVIARAITGVTSAAFFAISLSSAADMVQPRQRGRAASVVLAGLMLATVLGLPMSTLIDQFFDWRASFWFVAAMVLGCTILLHLITPAMRQAQTMDMAQEFAALRNGRLWAAYATSGLIIAATFSAFSYFAPIFTALTGFSSSALPWLFALYGAATVLGNIVVGRYADRYTMPVLLIGLSVLTLTLGLFALVARQPVPVIAATVVLGLVGVTMNPAMVARVMRVANARPLVGSIHGAIISLGVLVGSSLGAFAIESGLGLQSPLWIGALLALLGLLSLAPAKARLLDRKTED